MAADDDDVIEAEIVTREAEANAPFHVRRVFSEFDDFDLRVFALRCAGVPVSHIADRLDCSPDRVRRSIKARRVVHTWLDEFLPETERDRADRERQRQVDEKFERYMALWDNVIEKAEMKLESGDVNVIKALMKDLSVRMFGAVATKTKHEHAVEMKPVPQSMSGAVNRLLDDE